MSEVFELRQYTLHPGRRDELIELFERNFIEPQETAGMRLVGQFRDLDDPDRFVWIRSFPDMTRRQEALSRFYGGALWKAHRDAANATMIDSDNVLLLRAAGPQVPFSKVLRRPAGTAIHATVLPFDGPLHRDVASLLQRELGPSALLQSEHAENTFPQLPVRLGENVFVAVDHRPGIEGVIDALSPRLAGPPQRLRLEPTARSRMR